MKKIVLLLVACGLALGTWTAAGALTDRRDRPARQAAASAGRCPSGSIAGFGTVDEALVAARRLLISGKTISNQGRRHRLTPKNSPVLAIVELAPGSGRPLPGADGLRRIAARRCGTTLASAAWAVTVDYAFAQIAGSSPSVSFLVKTTRGWRAF